MQTQSFRLHAVQSMEEKEPVVLFQFRLQSVQSLAAFPSSISEESLLGRPVLHIFVGAYMPKC